MHFLKGKRGRNITIPKSDSLTFNPSELCTCLSIFHLFYNKFYKIFKIIN